MIDKSIERVKCDQVFRYNRRLEYFFPITEIKIRNWSINNDEFIFSCIRKIRTELKSDKYIVKGNIVQERFILKEFYEETEKQILTSYHNTN